MNWNLSTISIMKHYSRLTQTGSAASGTVSSYLLVLGLAGMGKGRLLLQVVLMIAGKLWKW